MTPLSYSALSIWIPIVPTPEQLSKPRNQILLELFIQNTAQIKGFSAPITLVLVKESDICKSNIEDRIITISQDRVKSYGSKTIDTLYERFLDLLATDPNRLLQTLYNLNERNIALLKSLQTREPSDLEIEGQIMHEIGHIAFYHTCGGLTTKSERHCQEYMADFFTFSEPGCRTGLARIFKREILRLFLGAGKASYNRFFRKNLRKVTFNHPSMANRLKNIALFEQGTV